MFSWPVRAMLLSDRRCCLVACKYLLGPSSITMFCEMLYGRCIVACGARDIAQDTCKMSPSPRRLIGSIGCWTSPTLKKKNTNRGPRLTPEGLRPRHPRRGGLRSQCLCPCCEWPSKTSCCSDMLTRGILRSLRPSGSSRSPYNYSPLSKMFVRVLADERRSDPCFLIPWNAAAAFYGSSAVQKHLWSPASPLYSYESHRCPALPISISAQPPGGKFFVRRVSCCHFGARKG
jgi:hypothetical protein